MAKTKPINKRVIVKGAFIKEDKVFTSNCRLLSHLKRVRKMSKQLIDTELKMLGYQYTRDGNIKPIGEKYSHYRHSKLTLKSLGISQTPLDITIKENK